MSFGIMTLKIEGNYSGKEAIRTDVTRSNVAVIPVMYQLVAMMELKRSTRFGGGTDHGSIFTAELRR